MNTKVKMQKQCYDEIMNGENLREKLIYSFCKQI